MAGQARKSLWIETVQGTQAATVFPGQARKSLWIETKIHDIVTNKYWGQARKSLWIETGIDCTCLTNTSRSGS